MKHGIKPNDFIKKAREVAPMFSWQHFYDCSDTDYGIQPRGFVERHVKGIKHENRKNPNRIQFRCTNDMKARIINAMNICACATIQEFMTLGMKIFLEYVEKTAALSGTEDSGQEKYVTENISHT